MPIRFPCFLLLGTALAAASAAPALAQYPAAATVQSLPQADDPAEQLAAALRTLAASPSDLAALLVAGHNALALGDANAAVGFFGRANAVAPRDGRVKAGLGAALVQLERPTDALRYFAEARRLGMPDADLAADRGLAYDLTGDPGHAQQDYRTELAAHPDDDATRRKLALSQGIAGDRKGALATLDPLIRRRDIAAWRAQTFVLAMTGDADGANAITRIMLPQQQAMLQPFLVRLAALSPTDKARAVHFGEMPAAARVAVAPRLAAAAPAPLATPAAVAATPQSPAALPAVPQRAPVAVASTPTAAPAAAMTPAATVASATPTPTPTTTVAAAAPTGAATAGAASRYVAPDGTPLRRVASSWQDVANGAPAYSYVPLAGLALSRAPAARTAAAAASPVTPAVAALSPAVARGAPAAATASPTVVASAAPFAAAAPTVASPGVAPPSVAAGLPMPLGSSAAAGHYDLPHDAAERRRPLARTPVSVGRPAPALGVATSRPAELARAEPAASNGTPSLSPAAPVAPQSTPDEAAGRASRAPTVLQPVQPTTTTTTAEDRGETAEPARASARATQTRPAASAAPVARVAEAATIRDRAESATARPAARPPATKPASIAPAEPIARSRGTKLAQADSAPATHGDDEAPQDEASAARKGKERDVAAPFATGRTGRSRAREDEIATADRSSKVRSAESGDRTGKSRDADRDADSTDRKGRPRTASRDPDDGSGDRKGKTRAAARDGDTGSSRTGKAQASDDDKGRTAGKRRDADDAVPAKGGGAKVYVQVAGGANREDMDKAWAGVRKKAPELMKGHAASTTPVHATNRLLVGPFKDEDEAQAFVNKMAGKGLSGFVFKSAKGQKVDRVDTGG